MFATHKLHPGYPAKPSCRLLLILSFQICVGAALTAGAAEWKTVTSRTGAVTVQIPGDPEERVLTTRTLAGKMTTYVTRYETDSVIFDLSYTPLSQKLVKFIGAERIFENTRGKVLQEAMGKMTSFEPVTISGKTCYLMKYEMINPDGDSDSEYAGLTLMAVLDDGLYVANGVVTKKTGMEDIKKFGDSISFNK